MSLNWREIDLILEELELSGSYIQQIIQPDFRHLVLEMYCRTGRFSLLFSLEQGATRFHRTRQRTRKNRKPQRFEVLLRSRIRGGRIRAVEHVERERILRFEIEKAETRSVLWARLWGGAANIILTDQSNTIIDCFYRRPKRGEASGFTFDVEKILAGRKQGDQDRFQVRDYHGYQSFNDAIDHEYAHAADRKEIERLRRSAGKLLRQADSRLSDRLGGLRAKAEAGNEAHSDRKCGDLILANLHRIWPGSETLVAEDWENAGTSVEVPLKPEYSPQENARLYYERAKKRERERKNIDEHIEQVAREVGRVRDLIEELDTIEDIARLQSIVAEYSGNAEKGGSDAGAKAGGSSRTSSGRASSGPSPGLRLEVGGFTVIVGRNARENDELLRRHVRGNDLWLHTRDYAGGYVFIRSVPGKSIPLEVMLDAAQLAIRFSKAPAESSAVDLYYTWVKHLKRPKDGPRGMVIPTSEKNLTVEPDDARLRKVLGNR
ncbi:MAG: NFACT RNA binding domain-containing protein [Spirochaetota bacterium]